MHRECSAGKQRQGRKGRAGRGGAGSLEVGRGSECSAPCQQSALPDTLLIRGSPGWVSSFVRYLGHCWMAGECCGGYLSKVRFLHAVLVRTCSLSCANREVVPPLFALGGPLPLSSRKRSACSCGGRGRVRAVSATATLPYPTLPYPTVRILYCTVLYCTDTTVWRRIQCVASTC